MCNPGRCWEVSTWELWLLTAALNSEHVIIEVGWQSLVGSSLAVTFKEYLSRVSVVLYREPKALFLG